MEHVNKAMEAVKPYHAKLTNYLNTSQDPFCQFLAKAETATGVKRERIVYACVAVVFTMLVLENALLFMGRVVTFSYPTYMSFKAIESTNKSDDTQWLTYWVVFASFNLCEVFIDIILFWFPLYHTFKLFLLVWCMAPIEFNGSTLLYERFLRQFFIKHEAHIDEQLDNMGKQVNAVAGSVTEMVSGKQQ